MAQKAHYEEYELEGYGISAVVDRDTLEVYIPGARLEQGLQLQANSVRKKFDSKSLKALPGMGLQVGKKTGLVENEDGRVDKQALYHIELVGRLLVHLALQGHEKAAAWLCVGFGDSVRSLALEKAGLNQKEKDRQEWLKRRLAGKVARRSLTDRLKDYGLALDILPNYSKATLDVYRLAGVLNEYRTAKAAGVKSFRDTLTPEQLREIERMEENLAQLLRRGYRYEFAIQEIDTKLTK